MLGFLIAVDAKPLLGGALLNLVGYGLGGLAAHPLTKTDGLSAGETHRQGGHPGAAAQGRGGQEVSGLGQFRSAVCSRSVMCLGVLGHVRCVGVVRRTEPRLRCVVWVHASIFADGADLRT